jgi:hypothetical protein
MVIHRMDLQSITLVVLPDHRDDVPIAGGAHSMNLGESVDWGVKKTQQHEY